MILSSGRPGQIQQIGAEPDKVPSLAALQNLSCLERLDMEETQVRDESLKPLSNFQRLNYLSLRGSLTDMCLYHFSSIRNLMHLSVRDAVLTGGGLASFSPPTTLKVLDLRGCWLLTKEVLLSFCQRYPHIEVRHELHHFLPSHQGGCKHPPPSQETSKNRHWRKKEGKLLMLPHMFEKDTFIGRFFTVIIFSEALLLYAPNNYPFDVFEIDQRLKYSREELLAMQVSSVSLASRDRGNMTPEQL